ncbi:hypothetical protein U0L13_000395 [Providencia stuartii]|nr:hypothetical protein [Providencia stuartii]
MGVELGWNLGFITFENFWHEKLKYVRLYHTTDNGKPTDMTLYHVENGSIIKKAGSFEYDGQLNYWRLEIITERGEKFITKNNFYCTITEEDDPEVIIGVNGDARTMYVAFSHSSGCKTKLLKV